MIFPQAGALNITARKTPPKHSEHELHPQLHTTVAVCVSDHSELTVGKVLGSWSCPCLLIPYVKDLEPDIGVHALEDGKRLRHSNVRAVGREHACTADEARRVT